MQETKNQKLTKTYWLKDHLDWLPVRHLKKGGPQIYGKKCVEEENEDQLSGRELSVNLEKEME